MRRETKGAALAGLGATLAIACGDTDGGRGGASGASGIGSIGSASASASDDSGSDPDSGDEVDSGGSQGTNPAGTADDEDDHGDGPVFDLGIQPDVNQVPEMGCTKVDFLFVIDNSGSMGDNQVDLANNFPNFIDGIQNTLTEVNEYQVGVVTSDAYQFNSNGCKQLGALVTKTGGTDSSNAQCGPYAEGHNYMTEADDLA
ncbi:MAG TPA: vWA domain-containing protein, partial [Nannocystaceae bacterium]|nr:vWA domain-containing protein [Nannocystaceae bacterium]